MPRVRVGRVVPLAVDDLDPAKKNQRPSPIEVTKEEVLVTPNKKKEPDAEGDVECFSPL